MLLVLGLGRERAGSCSGPPARHGGMLRLRGGSEALHAREYDPPEKRLLELERMHLQGHLSAAELDAERERILLGSASRKLDLQRELDEADTEALSTLNATVARLANNRLARMLAERPQLLEAGDGAIVDA